VIVPELLGHRRIDRPDNELAAALLVVLHQAGQVEPVVDDRRRMIKIAAKAHRLGQAGDGVLMAGVAVLVGVPVVDSERSLAFERLMVVRHRVEQAPGGDLLSGLVGVDGGRDVVLLQEQAEVKTRNSGPDDGDAGHAHPPWTPPR
jgi:hypothetical protein